MAGVCGICYVCFPLTSFPPIHFLLFASAFLPYPLYCHQAFQQLTSGTCPFWHLVFSPTSVCAISFLLVLIAAFDTSYLFINCVTLGNPWARRPSKMCLI
ncbi:hypothetical protein F4809DRAFT_631253 [Biscogniauxia mediterranea]|nr:hypothetical protein F4809DRAFT_631253 [Biscogniauxia mediterranea]